MKFNYLGVSYNVQTTSDGLHVALIGGNRMTGAISKHIGSLHQQVSSLVDMLVDWESAPIRPGDVVRFSNGKYFMLLRHNATDYIFADYWADKHIVYGCHNYQPERTDIVHVADTVKTTTLKKDQVDGFEFQGDYKNVIAQWYLKLDHGPEGIFEYDKEIRVFKARGML